MNPFIREISKSALLLAAFGLAGTVLLGGINAATEGRITENERQALLERINTLIKSDLYDNDPLHDRITLPAAALQSATPVTVYRARKQGQPVAAVFVTTTLAGYNGNIRLVVGVDAQQTLSGVRVVAHKETPGLGDKIDLNKNDWVLGFTGKSLQNPAPERWAVKKDGGDFDQFTGATITPRAMVGAVKNVLVWAQQNRDMLFTLPAEGGN